jgi:hypothetical protein
MKPKPIAYWVTTAVLVFCILSGGLGELARVPGTIGDMLLLGYPLYFISIIGFWKVLGSIALLAPKFPRLKEWAYAGIFFNMTGALVSHLVRGDYGAFGYHIIATAVIAVLVVASWALRPQSRTFGVLFAPKNPGPTRRGDTAPALA